MSWGHTGQEGCAQRLPVRGAAGGDRRVTREEGWIRGPLPGAVALPQCDVKADSDGTRSASRASNSQQQPRDQYSSGLPNLLRVPGTLIKIRAGGLRAFARKFIAGGRASEFRKSCFSRGYPCTVPHIYAGALLCVQKLDYGLLSKYSVFLRFSACSATTSA